MSPAEIGEGSGVVLAGMGEGSIAKGAVLVEIGDELRARGMPSVSIGKGCWEVGIDVGTAVNASIGKSTPFTSRACAAGH